MEELDLDRIRQLALTWAEGTPEERLQANIELRKIKDGLEGKELDDINGYIADVQADAITAQTGEDLKSEQKELLRRVAKTHVGVGAAKAVAGLAQVVDAMAKKSKLEAPKLPDEYRRNENLAQQLNESKVRQDIGDPKLRAYFESRAARGRSEAGFRAQSAGNVGQYVAGTQASQVRENDALRQFSEDEFRRKAQYRGETNQLIGQQLGEDARRVNDYWKRFGAMEDRYQSSLGSLQAQQNSGLSNIFKGVGDIAESAPFLQSEPLNESQVLMLGNPGFRTEPIVQRFQDMARALGEGVTDAAGSWGRSTQAAYDKVTQFDPVKAADIVSRATRGF